ncbi:hypothetical protein Sste5346_006653 [Sporothrix stenoceras]|uniref:Conserved oligomeric Golgi complex subunit 2 n=1 Tax=Sporothrix stenoceras TaxID=5173 RepID=A0ABR3YX92_9PEZI
MESAQHSSARGRPPPSPYSTYSGFQLPSSSSSDSGAEGNGNGRRNGNGNGFGFGADDDEDDFDDDDLGLPFPTALSRKDFLTPAFDATAYLSSLFPSGDDNTSSQRLQTLEDLRAELRERSSAISAELLELVNANYTSFLGLGDELKGGDEKVEDVRVALFGFRRSVEDVQARVRERRVAVGDACQELGQVRTAIDTGRRLLELDERVAQLEDKLSIGESGAQKTTSVNDEGLDFADIDEDEEDEEEDEDDNDETSPVFVASGPRKLVALARDLLLATRLADSLGHQLPLVKKIDERLTKCESTLIMDLNAAVKEARSISRSKNKAAQARLLKLLAVYRVLDREDEVVRVLKEK